MRNGTPENWTGTVYIIDQHHQDGSGFDEHKVMIGWDHQIDAERAYLGSYTRDWVLGPVTAMSWADFKQWCKNGDHTCAVAKTWTQSTSATSGITAYGNTDRRKRKPKITYSTRV